MTITASHMSVSFGRNARTASPPCRTRAWMLPAATLVLGLLQLGCGGAPKAPAREPLLVAAASNLSGVFDKIGAEFTQQSGVEVKFNYGATVQLAQQIEHGAEFDLLAAADTEHVDQLVKSGAVLAASRAIYARGKLALWVPAGSQARIKTLRDLAGKSVRFVAIANPDVAPYGAAAEQLLRAAELWDALQPRLVRAENVTAARQTASTGNADAAFTAYSLVFRESGTLVPLDTSKLAPINQALAIPARSTQPDNARKFADYILHGPGREVLREAGYDLP
jgi:molybdate transport system substrate-binding protein